MAQLTEPRDVYDHFQQRALEGIKEQFPIAGRVRTIELDGLEVDDSLHPDDIRTQHQAKVSGQTWGVPVYANLTLRDNSSGKPVNQGRVRVAVLPKTTRRHSYIVDGQEYQVDNQWQLKPGAYVRRRQTGELETRFQTSGRPSFDVSFDDASKQFKMDYLKAKLPLYPILKTLGVSDDELKRAWGEEVLEANKGAKRSSSAVEQYYRSSRRAPPASRAEAEQFLRDSMAASRLRPDSTEITLGKPFGNVTGDALKRATVKMLQVQKGAPEDDRDSLMFKDLRTVGDYAYDKIRAARPAIRQKVHRKVNTAERVGEVVKFDTFNKPVKDTFHKNSAVDTARQINPVEMLAGATQTTVMGPGGIQSEQQIVNDVKFINPSHLGFLDPINTPEGSKAGVTLRLPMSLVKEGYEPRIPLYNKKKGKIEYVGPGTFIRSKVVLPDQVTWENGKPKPRSSQVKFSDVGNEVVEGKYQDADYVMRHPSQLFNLTSNLIPFMSSDSGGRAGYAARHMEQSISLTGREQPMVQVGTPLDKPDMRTFEQVIGKAASHTAPTSGTVAAVRKDGIVIRDRTGKPFEVQLYDNYPLNDAKSVLDSTPLVKKGDKVRSGQTIADTNFSKDGTLALGTNLRVAYVPYKGYNFEDGVVIADSAAGKLSSEHLYKHHLPVDADTVVSKIKFRKQHQGSYTKDQLDKVGDDGVVQVGMEVDPGDPLILATRGFKIKDRSSMKQIRRGIVGQHTDKSLAWDGDTRGKVVGVFRKGKQIAVHVRTTEPMQVGDKITGRHGNKGIVTRIIPDDQMPKTPDGRPIQVLLNPAGVGSRTNVGQVLETAASKVAEKTGKPYVVDNFDPANMLEKVKSDLKLNGLKDTEPLYDPITKQPMGEALVGNQYLFKLHHQVDKKVATRSGLNLPGMEPQKYDLNFQPAGRGHAGGQAMDPLGLYALLAHGAKANIREMQTWKSEGPDVYELPSKRWNLQHNDVWDAIQHGEPLPPPKPTFAFKKFESLLKGAGINMEKKGHKFILTPLTDSQIKSMAEDRILPKPADRVYAKLDPKSGEPKPIPGGLFDEKLTGGHGGKKWTRIKLSEPIPNPVFEKPIRSITGLSDDEYSSIVGGEKAVGKDGSIVPLGKGATGGQGIKLLLDRVDVNKDLQAAAKELDTAPKTKVDGVLKKVKYLKALKIAGQKPSEAYVLNNLPVLPPAMRPITVLPDGNLNVADVNKLYTKFALVNQQLGDPVLKANLTPEGQSELRRNYYDGMKAVMGAGVPYKDAKHRGLIHEIQGAGPKEGYFQDVLIGRKQDLSMRSIIVPEPALGLDEVGLPKEHAMKLFAPFVVRKLRDSGIARNAAEGQKMVAQGKPQAWRALERVTEDHPVLLKRDPVLHKYGVQGFKPRLVEGNAIKIHPLITGGYNADFDGDTMSVFVPVSEDAKKEAVAMMPSNNLFSEATGEVMYQPTHESALGLYKLSKVNKNKPKAVASYTDAIEKTRQGKLNINDQVKVGKETTTTGRILMAAALPQPMQSKMLTDFGVKLNKGGVDNLFTDLAKNYRSDFGDTANKLKDIGNGAATGVVPVIHKTRHGMDRIDPAKTTWIPIGASTISLDDLTPDIATRERALSTARQRVGEIQAKKMPKRDKDRLAIAEWKKADAAMKEAHLKKPKESNLRTMLSAKARMPWDQYKQITLAPMILTNSAGQDIPTPVTHSYSEGLDTGEYWTQMAGARRGVAMKTQEVREPGYLSKLLTASTMDMLVGGDDCGTSRGIALPVTDKNVYDRYLQKDFKARGMTIPAGTLLTPDVVGKIRQADKNASLLVRSPLKCEHAKGVCQKCMGKSASGQDHQLGENVGIAAAQSMGERAVQLTMRVFHTGGVSGTGGTVVGGLDRFKQLTMLPKNIPNAATLAMRGGTVEDIKTTPTGVDVVVGGKKHHIGRDPSGAPLHLPVPGGTKVGWSPPRVGMKVDKGQFLSDPGRTHVNPHDLYKATGSMENVQNYLTDSLNDLFQEHGIKRVQSETVVKAMSNLTKVKTPGDYEGVLRGEFHPTSKISAINRELAKAGRKPIEHEPVLKGADMLPLSLQEDWMAKLNHQRLGSTIMDAAATYGQASIHGFHPIPGMAYGAEFGLTEKDIKGKPSLQYLADVPNFVY
jgi:DNA-directed RNA polymerase subunit beta'